jgi:hypothetical protein
MWIDAHTPATIPARERACATTEPTFAEPGKGTVVMGTKVTRLEAGYLTVVTCFIRDARKTTG